MLLWVLRVYGLRPNGTTYWYKENCSRMIFHRSRTRGFDNKASNCSMFLVLLLPTTGLYYTFLLVLNNLAQKNVALPQSCEYFTPLDSFINML